MSSVIMAALFVWLIYRVFDGWVPKEKPTCETHPSEGKEERKVEKSVYRMLSHKEEVVDETKEEIVRDVQEFFVSPVKLLEENLIRVETQKHKEEAKPMNNNYYLTKFSLDLPKFIRVLSSDPACREEIEAALAAGSLPTTEHVGSEAPSKDYGEWRSVFIGTDINNKGSFFRTKQGRLVLNIKPQKQQQTSPVSEKLEGGANDLSLAIESLSSEDKGRLMRLIEEVERDGKSANAQ